MTTLAPFPSRPAIQSRANRSIADLLAPLDQLVATSPNLIAKSAGRFESGGQFYDLPRYLFIGPQGGDDPIRIGLFAGIHGDEPEGIYASVNFLVLLEKNPELARGYCFFVYPVCNPTGYEDNTRQSRRGRDLNREFWNNTSEPEVQLLQSELWSHAFHGLVALHSDDTSHGMYGFVKGATLTRNLLDPALHAAAEVLPRNDLPLIDGFNAQNGIIRRGYHGILSAPPSIRPRPFEIVLETPQSAPRYLQVQAQLIALQTIVAE